MSCLYCDSDNYEIFGSCVEGYVEQGGMHLRNDAKCKNCGKTFDFTSAIPTTGYQPASAIAEGHYIKKDGLK